MLVKICGIMDSTAAEAAAGAGADLLGFIFVPETKRYIKPEAAGKIIESVKGRIKTVGVFRDEDPQTVNRIAGDLDLDYIQLHGSETPRYVSLISGKVIKAFNLSANFNPEDVDNLLSKYRAELFLLDREKVGEGAMLDTAGVDQLSAKYRLLLSGGLAPGNIGEVLSEVSPAGVDVSSGVETEGKKDPAKIRQFIKMAKGIQQ